MTDNHGTNKAKKHKCSICGQEYTIHDPKNPNMELHSIKEKPFRFPDEWNEKEILAHRISHIESSKARRLAVKFVSFTKSDREEFQNFIKEI